MSGLLDFALGFGSGAAGAFAQTKQMEIANRAEETRMKNLERLRAQYQRDNIDYKAEVDRETTRQEYGLRTELARTENQLEGDSQATTAMRTREQRINDIMGTYGVDRSRATKLVDNDIILSTTDRGDRALVDRVTGEVIPLTSAPPEEPERSEAPTPEITRESLTFDPAEGTGFVSAASQLWNRTAGQFPFFGIAEGPEEAAQKMRMLRGDAIRALSMSGRPPLVEQERIGTLFPTEAQFLQNPQVAANQTASGLALIAEQYRADVFDSNNASLDTELRTNARRRAAETRQILQRYLKSEVAESIINFYEPLSVQADNEQEFLRFIEENNVRPGIRIMLNGRPFVYNPRN